MELTIEELEQRIEELIEQGMTMAARALQRELSIRQRAED